MKRLLTLVLLIAAPTVVRADLLQGTFNPSPLPTNPVAPLSIGPADVGNIIQDLGNPSGTPEYNPAAYPESGFSPGAFENYGTGLNFGNPLSTNETTENSDADLAGSGGSASGSGSGGAGGGMPLIPYNQGFPGY